jgi:hypothetical protein
MATSRQRWVVHLLSSVGFSFIALSALQIFDTPVPASAAPHPDETRAATETPRLAAPSVLRERSKPRKKGDSTVTREEPSPAFLVSPRPPGINILKRSAQ